MTIEKNIAAISYYRHSAQPLRATAALFIAFATASGCASVLPEGLGVRDGKLTACPVTPNCVSSDETGPVHGVAPFRIKGDPVAAWNALQQTVAQESRTNVVLLKADYLHVEFKSLVFRFVDDVEFHLRPDQRVIAVRSASRVGKSDLGVNAKRVERIRALLIERDVVEAGPPQ